MTQESPQPDVSPWLFGDSVVDKPPQGAIGFVYRITNKINNKFYIGKKGLLTKKYRQVKGKRKGYYAESDWRSYWSSSDEVCADVGSMGENSFVREVLVWCSTKSEMSYYETYLQFTTLAIIDPMCYNGWISCKINRKHLRSITLENHYKGNL